MVKYRVKIKTDVDIRYEFEHSYYVNANSEDEAEKIAYQKAKANTYEGICDVSCQDDVLVSCKEVTRAIEVVTTEENDGDRNKKPERFHAPASLLRNTRA